MDLNGLKSQSIPEVETLYLCIIRAKIKLTVKVTKCIKLYLFN